MMWKSSVVIPLLAAFHVAHSSEEIWDQVPFQADEHQPTLPSTPLLDLHRSLVEIESISGNENAVGEWLTSYLRALNLTVEKQAVTSSGSSYEASKKSRERFNILAYPHGYRQTRTLFSSHIDVVPSYYNYTLKPPSRESRSSNATKETEIWGRGTVDDKACVASQITAFESLRASGDISDGDVSFLFVVGEETGGDGMRAANDLGLTWEAVIFGEPTESKLAAGHKGLMQFDIKAKGTSAHSGYPWLGQSANEILIAAVAALERLKVLPEKDGGLPSSEKYGNTTINVGKIRGGVAGNVIAETAKAIVAGRIAAGTAAKSQAICLKAIEEATKPLLENGKGSLEVVITAPGYSPVDLDTIEGFDQITVNYGTDVPNLKGDHKRYLYGPGSILVAHSDHEHLTVGELEQSVEDYKKILLSTLKR